MYDLPSSVPAPPLAGPLLGGGHARAAQQQSAPNDDDEPPPPPPVAPAPTFGLALPAPDDLPSGPILGSRKKNDEPRTSALSVDALHASSDALAVDTSPLRTDTTSLKSPVTKARKGLFGLGGSSRTSNPAPAATKKGVILGATSAAAPPAFDPEFKLYDEADVDAELAKDKERQAERPEALEVKNRKANLNRISTHNVHLQIEEVSTLPASSPANMTVGFDNTDEDALTLRVCERRGWRTMPTQNPHVMRALIKELNPWKNQEFLQAAHLSDAVRSNIYSTPKTFAAATEYKPAPGDVVVCGPPRGGQTPVLHALCSLRSGVPSTKADALLEQSRWLEGPGASPASSTGLCKGKPGRLIKTHMSPPRGEEHKIIAVLRDPKDLRVSWFRHVRRLFMKTCKTKKKMDFDGRFFLNDFVQQVSLGVLQGPADSDYEDFVLDMARAPPAVVCIVFYEEIIASPYKVVQRLADFTGWGKGNEELIGNVTQALVQDKNHPSRKKRFGSCGAGQELLSNDVAHVVDERWRTRIQKRFKQFGEYGTYGGMFLKVTGVPFPFGAVVEDAPAAARKSGMGSPELPPRKGAGGGATSSTSSDKASESPGTSATTAGQQMRRYPKPTVTGKVVKYPDPDQSDDEDAGANKKLSIMARMSARISTRR